jgi:hypothetical protein
MIRLEAAGPACTTQLRFEISSYEQSGKIAALRVPQCVFFRKNFSSTFHDDREYFQNSNFSADFFTRLDSAKQWGDA